jgi:hypothetical protein
MHLIYLRSNAGVLLSKKQYSSWYEIQDDYEDYMTSLGPWSEEDVIDFFRVDWGSDESRWPFSRRQIQDFVNSSDEVLQAQPHP